MFAVWERFWERTLESGNEAKSHKINGPCIFVCSHNPKVVSSNLTSATRNNSAAMSSEDPATIRIDKSRAATSRCRYPKTQSDAIDGFPQADFWLPIGSR
jgi:hypothetical protein